MGCWLLPGRCCWLRIIIIAIACTYTAAAPSVFATCKASVAWARAALHQHTCPRQYMPVKRKKRARAAAARPLTFRGHARAANRPRATLHRVLFVECELMAKAARALACTGRCCGCVASPAAVAACCCAVQLLCCDVGVPRCTVLATGHAAVDGGRAAFPDAAAHMHALNGSTQPLPPPPTLARCTCRPAPYAQARASSPIQTTRSAAVAPVASKIAQQWARARHSR